MLGVNVIGVKHLTQSVDTSHVLLVLKKVYLLILGSNLHVFFFLLIWNSPDLPMTKLEGLDMVCDCLVQRKSDPSDVMYIVLWS